MKEQLVNVLLTILPEFERNADYEILCSKLRFSSHITRDEFDLIISEKTSTAKFLKMFTLLKAKNEQIFKRLQEICIETKWTDLYDLVQEMLTQNNVSHLVLTKEEHDAYQVLFRGTKPKSEGDQPILFDVKDPAVDFVGRESQLKELHHLLKPSLTKSPKELQTVVITDRAAAIAGLGGIGKTQMALKYVQLYKQEYSNNICWINAETEPTLRESFRRLAQSLDISAKSKDGREKDFTDLIKEVYSHLSKSKCLIIFDSADKPINDEFYPSGSNKICIIITSRFQKWGAIKVLQLGNFTEDEAMQFIKAALNVGDSDAMLLAATLHLFPLVIKQATSYIKEINEMLNCVGTSFTIADYLEEYKEKKQELLSHKFFTDYGNTNSQTTYTTWAITIRRISEIPNGKLSLTILDYISYLASEKIDPKIFLELKNEVKEIGAAIHLLKQYSMISEENGLLAIHPLIQEVTRLNLKEKDNEMQTFTDLCQLVNKYFGALEKNTDYKRKQQILPHFETLLAEMKKWLDKHPSERKQVEQSQIENLFKNMYSGYMDISECGQSKKILEELLILQKEHFGPDHVEIARTLCDLGTVYDWLGDQATKIKLLEKALAMQEKALTIQEKVLAMEEKDFRQYHYEISTTLNNLGQAYGEMGEIIKAMRFFEKALAIRQNLFGPEHFELSPVLNNLGMACGILGNYEMEKKFLEKSLSIQEKQFGPDQFEVGTILNNLGMAYEKLGQIEKGITFIERALAIQEKHYGSEHFEVGQILNNLGVAYGKSLHSEKAKTLLEKALAIQEKHFGPDHLEVATTLSNLAMAHECLGNDDKSKILLEKAFTIRQKHFASE